MSRLLLATAVLAGCVGLSVAWADQFDPATLFIGNGASGSCPTGGCPVFGGEVNPNTGTLSIFQNQGGAPDLTSPVELILGVPNNSVTLTTSNITSANLFDPYPGSGSPIGVTFNTSASMTAGQDVYGVLGLIGNNSESFTNWQSWDASVNGLSGITNFGIYVFNLNTGSLGAKDLINVVTNGLPLGTFAAAWGQASPGCGKKTQGNCYGTPFTEAGLTTAPPVPEPASLLLLGTGLLGLGGVARRRLRTKK